MVALKWNITMMQYHCYPFSITPQSSKKSQYKVFLDFNFSLFNSLFNILKSDLILLTYCPGVHITACLSSSMWHSWLGPPLVCITSLPWFTFSLSDHSYFNNHLFPSVSECEWSPSFCPCFFSLCLTSLILTNTSWKNFQISLFTSMSLLNACW